MGCARIEGELGIEGRRKLEVDDRGPCFKAPNPAALTRAS